MHQKIWKIKKELKYAIKDSNDEEVLKIFVEHKIFIGEKSNEKNIINSYFLNRLNAMLNKLRSIDEN